MVTTPTPSRSSLGVDVGQLSRLIVRLFLGGCRVLMCFLRMAVGSLGVLATHLMVTFSMMLCRGSMCFGSLIVRIGCPVVCIFRHDEILL
jgi:hypothetical protein